MNSLIPERRTDRNGRTQTRWVKPSVQAAAPHGIPAPAAAAAAPARPSHDAVLAEIGDLIGITTVAMEEDRDFADEVLATILDADGDRRVLGALGDAILSLDDSNQHLGLKLRFALVESLYGKHMGSSPLGNPYRYQEIRESALFYVADAADRGPSDPETRESVELALALGFMGAACWLRDVRAGGPRPHSTTANYFYDHPALVGVFDEYRARARELAEFVIGNGTEAGAARAFMRGEESTALSDGLL